MINAYNYQRLSEAGKCAQCKHRFKPKEPVWRWRIGTGRNIFGGWSTTIISTCKACSPDYLDVTTSSKCANCGRKVNQTEWQNYRNFYCSELCRQKHRPGFQAALAREERARIRGASRLCAKCGKSFAPTRNDAKFCSGRCKQRAYRERVTTNKKRGGGVIRNRNVRKQLRLSKLRPVPKYR
jgi:endogenous inhibitor of DNA gyrase (YacG/DUF329 family)